MTPHLFGPEINKNEKKEKRGKKKDIAVILLSS